MLINISDQKIVDFVKSIQHMEYRDNKLPLLRAAAEGYEASVKVLLNQGY
jgi:hypothetical protein